MTNIKMDDLEKTVKEALAEAKEITEDALQASVDKTAKEVVKKKSKQGHQKKRGNIREDGRLK